MLIISMTFIILSSYQKYVIDITRSERNYEAEFQHVSYEKALEIAKDDNVKEISIAYNIGESEENFSKDESIPIGSILSVDLKAGDKNWINNSVRLTEGRIPVKNDEIVISNKLIYNDKEFEKIFKIGNTIELTFNGKKNTYTIVGHTESLPNDVNGWMAKHNIGAFTCDRDFEVLEDTTVNVSILTNDISKIYETTLNLAEKLKLYEHSDESLANIKYNDILLNYALVDGENLNSKDYTITANNSKEFGRNTIKVVMPVLVITGVVSVFVIYTAFKMTYSERVKEIGMLSSIGISKKQKRNMLIKEALIVSTIRNYSRNYFKLFNFTWTY